MQVRVANQPTVRVFKKVIQDLDLHVHILFNAQFYLMAPNGKTNLLIFDENSKESF